ncbi:MAG: hypothetical protein L6Q81_14550 [Bacteroidia bacterium]|nr:hypothetical protein [Bacteroidia bacterium]
MNRILLAVAIAASSLTACVSPAPVSGTSNVVQNSGNARNWVMIMHGESCGGADDVAHNMYVENNHETAFITVTVYISWTENNQPRFENKTLSVGPDSKALIGCDLRNGAYLKMEIVNAQFNQ